MSLDALYARRALGVRLGLSAIAEVYDRLGRPGATIPTIHIVGTNGKGSVARMLEHGLRKRKMRTGVYTSPHLHRLGERVRVEGQSIDEEGLEAAINAVRAMEPRHGASLSFFELLTLAGLSLFERAGVEVKIVEAGLGGARDATRIVDAQVVAITSIGLDHQESIGPTLADIAREKAGAMRAGVPTVSAPQSPGVMAVLRRAASEVGSALGFVQPWPEPPRGMLGAHQGVNAAVALAAGRVIDPGLNETDLDGVRLPGRLEAAPRGLWLDVAHNPDGIEAVVAAIEAGDVPHPGLVLFGCHASKDRGAMEDRLDRLDCPRWWVSLATGEQRRGRADRRFRGTDDPALWSALEAHLQADSSVLCCGAHELVAAARAWAHGELQASDPQDPRP